MPEGVPAFTDYRELKAKIHAQILQDIDLESLDNLPDKVARNRVSDAIRDILHRDRTPLALAERERMVGEIVDELFGLGPIEPLLADSTVSDILVNGPDNIYVERRGVLESYGIRFENESFLKEVGRGRS